jgi:glycosyltransferase involved in cell wall biosynthesis
VFTLSYRGVPIFVRPTLAALRGLPLVALLHEYAYPWGRNGLRGALWSISQRVCLIDLVRASRALVLTADFRAAQLASRRWLPRRRMAVAPVFSNLPAPSLAAHGSPSQASDGAAPQRQGERERSLIGLFGYASEGTAQGLVLDALRLLGERGGALQLSLLGAPGADSSSGREWLAQAASRGIAGELSFSGRLSAQDLSDALADCELLLFADPTGPTSRKTTLAASLASGSAVVAIDGPHGWRELSEAQAARLVSPRADALAEAVEQLLADGEQRAELGRRGQVFARRAMTAQASAEIVAALLRELLSAPVG